MTEPLDVRSAEVVLLCRVLPATLAFFVERLGFRLDAISPADDPCTALVSGHGLRLRLERSLEEPQTPVVLRLVCGASEEFENEARVLVAPNGTRIELVAAEPVLPVPSARLAFWHTRAGSGARWGEGRAGMHYRDLLPDRLGGHLVASHIRIPVGGPVSDYVHFHAVAFQMIYCARGWVRVVYEDQGPPFVLAEGDCVLQPPRIRHRVLESSAGLEVVELGVPAAHETRVEHTLTLPTPELRPERDFGGQRFVRHERARARWHPWRLAGFEARDLGLGTATAGLVRACVARSGAPGEPLPAPAAAFRFLFVLRGSAVLAREGQASEPLGAADALLLPADEAHTFGQASPDLELLEVAFRDPSDG